MLRIWALGNVRGGGLRRSSTALVVTLLVSQLGSVTHAEVPLRFDTPGASDDLRAVLQAASATRETAAKDVSTAQDLVAAARADYTRILAALYDQGYYSGRISIRLDGREAATIPPLDAPDRIGSITILIESGAPFRFGAAEIGPLAPETELPPAFQPGGRAASGTIVESARAGVEGWRQYGHAKAEVSGQSIRANHATQTLDARVVLDPGPRLTFGTMSMRGYERMKPRRLAKIAGYPTGKRFDPDKLDEVRARLRRTGIFSSVSLVESETISPGNTLDAELIVTEAKPRRIGFGAELSSNDGVDLSGYWLHRNLWGGGERLRFDAEITGLGGAAGGADYSLGARIERPATLSPDTSAYIETKLEKRDEEDYTEDSFSLAFGLSHIFNDRLTGELAIEYNWAEIADVTGTRQFRQVALPMGLEWDNRDDPLDATEGYYGALDVTPYKGLGDTGSGVQIKGDFRTYRGFGTDDRFVLAGRAQFGAVYGSGLAETPREYLFYSGGGGSVRGQPYQTLGVSVLNGGTLHTGGKKYLAFSGELRGKVTDSIGLVGFYDVGYIAAEDFFDGVDGWHSGAGIGLRYLTGIGPIRLDLAAPVDGDTGDGMQIYLGIGQAF